VGKLLLVIGGDISLFLQRMNVRLSAPAHGEAIFSVCVEMELTSLPHIPCYPPME
jgi:hypothetical protein